MINPIPKSNLFITPQSLEQVMDFVKSMPSQEQAQAMTAVMFTLNWAHAQVEELQLQTSQGRLEFLRAQITG